MNLDKGSPEAQPIHADGAAAVYGYVELFARKVVSLTPEDEWFQDWSAYMLAVLLHGDVSEQTSAHALNETYSNGLNAARLERGKEQRDHRQFSGRQWQFFRRVVFSSIEVSGRQPTVDIKPEDLLAGIVDGTFRQRTVFRNHDVH